MITNRTLLAYEQFCENYYSDFSIKSRATDIIDGNVVARFGNSGDRRISAIRSAAEIGSKSYKHAKKGFPVDAAETIVEYQVPKRVLKKVKMKIDPYYKQKVIDAKEARRQYHSPEAIARRKADRATKKRIEHAAKKFGDWKEDEYV